MPAKKGHAWFTAAQAEIDQEINRAREELREKVAILAVSAAEKILEKEIDPTHTQASSIPSAKQI